MVKVAVAGLPGANGEEAKKDRRTGKVGGRTASFLRSLEINWKRMHVVKRLQELAAKKMRLCCGFVDSVSFFAILLHFCW